MILNEGKRDNQLLRFLEIYNQKTNQNISLGEFKSMMLKKLSFEGGIHNISLQSNYYLVGAVRYYFEGLLTNNKDLSIFTDPTQPDQWNTDVTRKLNAVILILRNGYIDNLGSEWIEPEDFGTMPLNQLFTKYSKEIKKLIAPPKKPVEKTPEVIKDYEMLTPKGYTYDIIYSFEDSKRYFNDTSPGAWCITYGSNHLSYYTKRGNGHFVIFRKEGYQDVPRVKQPEKWKNDKPQDDYGNSLIAYLQDNNSPGPANYGGAPLITSRWNHGSNGIYCEADRAYTQEEFQRITGVSNADLKGIYDTWKRNNGKNKSRTKTKVPKLDDDLLRELKYVQMRINGGENPALLVTGYDKSKVWSICSFNFSDESSVSFLMVNKKIIFETAIPDEEIELYYNQGVITAIELKKNKRYVLVNNRLKSVVQIDDKFFFKAVSKIFQYSYDEHGNIMTDEHDNPILLRDIDPNASYIEVKTGNFEIALVEPSSGLPVKLPNGQYWFNYIAGVHVSSARGGAVGSDTILKDTLYEIIYDLSSKEKYFLDSRTGKFLDFINNNNNAPGSYSLYTDDKFSSEYIPIVMNANGIDDENRRTNGQFQFFSGDRCILYKNGKRCSIEFEIDGLHYRIGYPEKRNVDYYIPIRFDQLVKVSANEMVVIIDEYATTKCAVVVNLDTSRVIQRHQGGTYWINKSNTNTVFACKNVLVLPIMNASERKICNSTLTDFYLYYIPASYCAYFYDTSTDSYIKNPYRRPTEYIFPRLDFRRGYDFIPIRIGQWPTRGYYWDESEKDRAKRFAKEEAVTRAYNPDDKKFYKVTLGRRGYEDVPSLASIDMSVSSNENVQINESDIVRMVKKVINEIIQKK